VACLQRQGSVLAPNCAQVQGPFTARVYFPYEAGATYTATGRGCAMAGNPQTQSCDTTGPSSATL
jgi:hypothetical protein